MTLKFKLKRLLESKKFRFFLINKKTKFYNELKKEIKETTSFLPDNAGLVQRMWHIINETTTIPICPECGRTVSFKSIKRGYSEFCSSYCSNHSEINNEKRRKTSIKRYGAENVSKTNYFKEKYKETINKKYGVDHYSKTNEYKIKFKSTMNKRYGVEHPMKDASFVEDFFKKYEEKTGFKTPLNNPEIRNKIIETLIEVYGVDHNLKIPEIIEKRKNTWIKNYGVEHPMKDINIFYKVFYNSVLQYKDYIFPSGRIEKIQGYEDKTLDELLSNGINEDDIIVNDIEIEKYIGQIYYEFNNKTHRYYPDIFIKSINTIIEVKSSYTYEKDIEKNLLKEMAIRGKNINFKFIIYGR